MSQKSMNANTILHEDPYSGMPSGYEPMAIESHRRELSAESSARQMREMQG